MECYRRIDGQVRSASHPGDSNRGAVKTLLLEQTHNYLHTDSVWFSHTHTQPTLNHVCDCVHFTHTVQASLHINVRFRNGDGAEHPQRFVSSHVGSLMLFNTLLTTFSRSFLALCSSSSDRFIFLLSCVVKQSISHSCCCKK